MTTPKALCITPVLNGFVVAVNCQTVVFTSLTDMCAQIQRYYEKPEEVEKEFKAKALNQTLGGGENNLIGRAERDYPCPPTSPMKCAELMERNR